MDNHNIYCGYVDDIPIAGIETIFGCLNFSYYDTSCYDDDDPQWSNVVEGIALPARRARLREENPHKTFSI